jgi:hypothetical protein
MIDHLHVPAPSTPTGAIGALIRCACGHGIGTHTLSGCHAGTDLPCSCRFTYAVVLDRAIAQAAFELQAAMPNTVRRHPR